jgi:hypothetical protein
MFLKESKGMYVKNTADLMQLLSFLFVFGNYTVRSSNQVLNLRPTKLSQTHWLLFLYFNLWHFVKIETLIVMSVI